MVVFEHRFVAAVQTAVVAVVFAAVVAVAALAATAKAERGLVVAVEGSAQDY